MIDELWKKIKALRKEASLTQQELADRLKISRAAISQWESSDPDKRTRPSTQNLIDLSKVFHCDLNDLLESPDTARMLKPLEFRKVHNNVEEAPKIVRMIPLISWVQAGKFCYSPNNFHPGDAEDWLPSIKKHGIHTYALRVRGDSMVSTIPNTRSYEPGTIIYVDPDKPVSNGSRVIVRLGNGPDDEITFKIYSEDSGKRYLRPLNPQFPTIELTSDMHICGVVVGAWYDD